MARAAAALVDDRNHRKPATQSRHHPRSVVSRARTTRPPAANRAILDGSGLRRAGLTHLVLGAAILAE